MGLPGMDGAWAAGFIHSLPLRSPRLCGFPIPHWFLQLRISAGECPAPTRAAVVQIHPGLPVFHDMDRKH